MTTPASAPASAPTPESAPASAVRRHGEFAIALVLDLLGSGGALLIGARTWQVVITPRTRPRPDDVLDVTGRTIDSASTALALVALAGVVAVLATRGIARRVVGLVIALAGAGLVWRALESAGAVGVGRARQIVADHHRTVGATGALPHVQVHMVWPVLSLACGVVVLLAGALIAGRGQRWGAMSARYEARPAAADEDPQKAARSLWTALDRGEDPTSR